MPRYAKYVNLGSNFLKLSHRTYEVVKANYIKIYDNWGPSYCSFYNSFQKIDVFQYCKKNNNFSLCSGFSDRSLYHLIHIKHYL